MKYANVSGKERENRVIPREIKIPNDRQWGIEIEALFFKRIITKKNFRVLVCLKYCVQYTEKLFFVYLKFKFNRALCLLCIFIC